MKRTLKKQLLLISAIAILMTLFTFGTLAACDQHVYNAALDKVVHPTCTEGGYTVMYCGACKQEMGIKDEISATGHLFKVDAYYPVGHNPIEGGYEYYTFECDCANTDNNTGVKCDAHTVRLDDSTGTPVKYFTVTFNNPWLSAGYDETVTYTNLANEWTDEYLGMVYVAEGDTAVYNGKTPYREKDRAYGKYVFNGWDASLENITQNTVLNAVFKGETVIYTITFVNGDGQLISTYIKVAHGDTDHGIETLFENNDPTKSETTLFKYNFTGWDRDITAFYDTCTVVPRFERIEKVYTYVYHDSQGNEFYREDLSYSSDAPVFTDDQKAEYIAKADDNKYKYQWSGEWCWNNSPDYRIHVPQYIPGSIQEGEEIHLYPVYNKKLIDYDILVSISFIKENPYYSLDEFIVQLTDANGQLIGRGYTDENGEFRCKVNYSYPIRVTVTSEDNQCSGEATINTLYNGYTTSCHIRLDAEASVDNPAFNCGCICHNSFFKPIWVRVLNILYKLFNIKFVCCDDMYASIGELLVYAK